MKGTPHALSLQPQHQRSQSLQDMDLSRSDKTWRVCDHRMLVNPVSDNTRHGCFDTMLEESDTVPCTTAACRNYCNSVGSRDSLAPLPVHHAKTNSMPVCMASTHVAAAMDMLNGNGTPYSDTQHENIPSPVSMSNSHSMCSIRESWGDGGLGQRALRTINDHRGDDLDSLVDLRKSLPPSTSMPLWLEQTVERRGRKVSVPAKLMTPKREEAPRKVTTLLHPRCS